MIDYNAQFSILSVTHATRILLSKNGDSNNPYSDFLIKV